MRVIDHIPIALIVLGLMLMASRVFGHDIYGGWKQPDNPNVSCCNDSDCRPTRAYVGEDGRWRAWDGLGWIIIPPEKVLPTDYAKDGRNHLCEKAGYIYCFSPTGPRS